MIATASLVLMVATAAGGTAAPGDFRLFELSERTVTGRVIRYPNAAVVDADINSDILVHLRPEALREASGRPITAEQQRVVEQLEALTALQEQVNSIEREVLKAGERAAAARARGEGLSNDELVALHAAFGRLDSALTEVERYVTQTRSNPRAVLDEAFPASSTSVADDLRAFLAREHEALQAKVAEDGGGSARTLELAAWLGEPPAQVHLAGYDNLAPGRAHLVDKMRFNFDEGFQAEYAAAQKLAQSAGSLNQLKKAAEDALLKKLNELRQSLLALPEHVDVFVKAAKEKDDPAVKELRTRAEALARSAKGLRDQLLPVLERALHPPADADPAVMLASTVNALQAARPAVKDVTEELQAVLKAADALAANTAKQLRPMLAAVSQDMATIIAAMLRADVAAAPTLATLKVKLSEARDTSLSLIETERREGDVITIRAVVCDGDACVPGLETVAHVRVRARGFVADTGAVVLFARGLNPDPGPFMPSAGAYAVIRYKGFRGDGEAGSPFFQMVAPGIGVSAVAIPQTDGSTKFAWMGTGHLFGDVLQVSIGFTPDLAPVWGFGIGLHRIAGLGAYF